MKEQSRTHRPRRNSQQLQQEKDEIREYLSKLRQIVPACPKDGKISRLDLIQHVIDYILQLQTTLVNHSVSRIINESMDKLPVTPPSSPHSLHQSLVNPRIVNSFLSNNQSESVQPAVPFPTKQHRTVRRPLGVLASLNQTNSNN